MRRLATTSIAFAVGVALAQYLFPAAMRLPMAVLFALLGVGFWIGSCLRPSLIFLGLAVALLWVQAYDQLVRTPAHDLEHRIATITLTVAEYPRATSYGASVTADLTPYAQVLLYLPPEQMTLRPGDSITITAFFRSTGQFLNGENNYLLSDGIFLTATPKGPISVSRPDSMPLRYLPLQWKAVLQEAIYVTFPSDVAPLITALLTGDKSGLSSTTYTALQRSGLAHAVAVSGMHVSFLAGFLCLISGRYRMRTTLLALPLLLAFLLLTGSGPSVSRAVMMQFLLLLAPLLNRESDGPTSLSFALLILLLQNPYSLGSLGLQLSFLSAAGILLFSSPMYERLSNSLPWKNRLTKFVLSSLCATLGALALTTPLLAYSFGMVSLVAPLTNLLTLWAVSLCFLGGLGAACLTLIHPVLGQFLGLPVTLLVRYLNWIFPFLAQLPYATLSLTSGYLILWAGFSYGLFVLTLAWRREARRPITPICCSVLLLCVLLLLTHHSYQRGSVTITVLDVGQGQSILLRAGQRTALVDCGGNERRNAGDIVADYLSDRGLHQLDLLVLTHFHADHANGVLELLERLPISVLVVPEGEEEDLLQAEILAAAEERQIQVVTITENRHISFDTAALTLYAPLGAGEINEAGLSVLCESKTFSALFTGDMDENIERRLIKYGALPDVDLLVAGHHGSASSTSIQLLEAVQPELVVISVGENRYNHPHFDTLSRVADTDAAIYRTDLQGNITITVREEERIYGSQADG